MDWLLMAIASAAFLGFYEISRKIAVRDNAVLPVLLVANVGGLAVVLLLLLVGYWGGERGHVSGLSIESLHLKAHLKVGLKACLVTTSWVLSYFAVKHLPISIAAPLRSLSPGLTVVGGLLIYGESPGAIRFVGMGIIFCGYLAFAWLGKGEGIHFHANRWVLLLLLGTFVGSLSGLYDKHLLQGADIAPTTLQFWFTIYNILMQSVLCLALWWKRRQAHPFTFGYSIPLVGALLVLADQFYFRALAQEGAMVSVISLARRGSVIISFSLGGILFREQLLRKKALALVLILLGLIVLLVG